MLDDTVSVSDEEIAEALVLCVERTKLLVEGAGAVGLAALLAGRVPGSGSVAVVLSGGNIDATTLISVLRHGLTQASRFLAIRLLIPDRPGELRNVLDLIARGRGNVVSVDHHREGRTTTALQTELEIVVSTRDEEHCQELLDLACVEPATPSNASARQRRLAAMAACPSCGFDNASTAKFCSECGAQLAAPAPTRREERKVVTVLFADMVGSTERAERLDPEDVRALLAPYHARLRHELERHGGTVEKFIGDAVVAVFGAPVAHEDDPERAVRAALAIQEAIAEMNEADPTLALEVRIGVNSGRDARRARRASRPRGGDRLRRRREYGSAPPVGRAPGGILVDEHTFRATERAIEYEAHEPIAAKGKAEPVPAWRAVARRASFGIDLADSRSPLVGPGGRARRPR